MARNTFCLKDKNGKKTTYRILLNIESNVNNNNYVIYTDEAKNKDGKVKAYCKSYTLSPAGNMTKLKSVSSEKEFDFLKNILDSLQE